MASSFWEAGSRFVRDPDSEGREAAFLSAAEDLAASLATYYVDDVNCADDEELARMLGANERLAAAKR